LMAGQARHSLDPRRPVGADLVKQRSEEGL
jgi:hypothetical protein